MKNTGEREDDVENAICFHCLSFAFPCSNKDKHRKCIFTVSALSLYTALLSDCSNPVEVAGGCWIRLCCACAHKPFYLFQWWLDLGGRSVRGERSLVDNLLQVLTFGPAEPYLNYLWAGTEWFCDKFQRLRSLTFLPDLHYRNSGEGLRMGRSCNTFCWQKGWLTKQHLASIAPPALVAVFHGIWKQNLMWQGTKASSL